MLKHDDTILPKSNFINSIIGFSEMMKSESLGPIENSDYKE
ncbi:sensor protein, partial [Ehrlichia ruminantium]